MSNDFKYYKLTPFKWFILENFPFIEADFDALTNYELFCKLGKEINKIIDAMNLSGEQVEALTDLVNNFFDTLDVQEEINNKLDEMAQDGTLAEIINQDIFTELNNKINKNTNDIAEMQRRKFLIVGDSYLEGWTPEGTYTSWGQYFLTRTGFAGQLKSRGGACFSNYNNSFYSLVDETTATDFTDVIIMGGYNDKDGVFNTIVSGIAETVTLIKTKFPNIKNIYIGMCAGSTLFDNTNKLASVLYAYIHGAKDTNCKYLNGVEFSLLLNSYFSSDGIHPSATGQYAIALNLLNAFYTGYANAITNYTSIGITPETGITGSLSSCGGYINNNILSIMCQSRNTFTCNDLELICNNSNSIKLGTINSNLNIVGNYNNINFDVPAIIKNNGLYYTVNANLLIEDKNVYFRALCVNENNSNYMTFSKIEEIQLSSFNATFITNTI